MEMYTGLNLDRENRDSVVNETATESFEFNIEIENNLFFYSDNRGNIEVVLE